VLHRYENVRNAAVVHQLSDQLEQTKSELVDATLGLSEANKNPGFPESTKARVQVTGYALTDDFAPDPVFSNDAPARSAYAVPKHTLPAAEKVLNLALSPMGERQRHGNLNHTIALMPRNRARKHLARFVDGSAQTETRLGVDILFADAHEARIWEPRSFCAVKLSPARLPISAVVMTCTVRLPGASASVNRQKNSNHLNPLGTPHGIQTRPNGE